MFEVAGPDLRICLWALVLVTEAARCNALIVDNGSAHGFLCEPERHLVLVAGSLDSRIEVREALRESIISTLNSRGGKTELFLPPTASPAVILVVGVNGGGKTTTIGKLAHKFIGEGLQVMLGSGDTFRAAAFEQLKTWGERTGASVGSYAEGRKPAQVCI
jgi:signal recognition particle GTPase